MGWLIFGYSTCIYNILSYLDIVEIFFMHILLCRCTETKCHYGVYFLGILHTLLCLLYSHYDIKWHGGLMFPFGFPSHLCQVSVPSITIVNPNDSFLMCVCLSLHTHLFESCFSYMHFLVSHSFNAPIMVLSFQHYGGVSTIDLLILLWFHIGVIYVSSSCSYVLLDVVYISD